MSFLINGVGFHILVHALPIQVAAQSTLAGIVIRAVGMMYLVDLDDAPGTVMKIFENDVDSTPPNDVGGTSRTMNVPKDDGDDSPMKIVQKQLSEDTVTPQSDESPRSAVQISTVEEVIDRVPQEAEDIQLQNDSDALAQIEIEKSKKKPIDELGERIDADE